MTLNEALALQTATGEPASDYAIDEDWNEAKNLWSRIHAGASGARINNLTEKFRRGMAIDPIEVDNTHAAGPGLFVGDGFHRIQAARKLGIQKIPFFDAEDLGM